jgi:hypothetical protein
MIEIKKSKYEKNNPDIFTIKLFIDGIPTKETGIQAYNNPITFLIRDSESMERLFKHSLAQIPIEIEKIILPWNNSLNDLVDATSITRNDEKFIFSFTYNFSFAEWKGLYSISEFVNRYSLRIADKEEIKFIWGDEDDITAGFDVTFIVPLSEIPIYKEFEKCESLLCQFQDEVEKSLIEDTYQNSVVLHLDLPEEVKVSCEQYLLYFVEFLRELGVEATAELQQKAGDVLFSVTPTSAEDALEKIKTALEIYLHLPSSIIVDSGSFDNEIAIQKLTANIYHLKGQLALEQAKLQAKDATIQAQQFLIRQQELFLSGEILTDSIKHPPKQSTEEDKIDLFGGKFSITKLKKEGFEANLPEIFRWLKNYLKKK